MNRNTAFIIAGVLTFAAGVITGLVISANLLGS
jgi:hypothetical protein